MAVVGREPTSMRHREASMDAVAVEEGSRRVTPPIPSDNEDEDELRDLSMGDAGELRAFVEKRRWFEGKLAVSRASEWGLNVWTARGERWAVNDGGGQEIEGR